MCVIFEMLSRLTGRLDAKVHLCVGRVGDGVAAKLDGGTVRGINMLSIYAVTKPRGLNRASWVILPLLEYNSDSLLHNSVPQGIAQSVTLSFKLERCCCLGGAGQLDTQY